MNYLRTLRNLDRYLNGDGCKVGMLFYSTNENVSEILNNFDFEGKTGLSVIGSGDQAFHLYDRGVAQLDLFDKNALAIYYYFLRVWTIKYLGEYYPPQDINIHFIKPLLKKVRIENKDEEDAYKFWYEFIRKYRFRKDVFQRLLNTSDFGVNNEEPYMTILRNKLQHVDSRFYNFDISSDIELDKKYDFIYSSNIITWLYGDESTILTYRDNLYNLLNDRGIVLCSSLSSGMAPNLERRIFEKKFDYCELPKTIKGINGSYRAPGYYFVKR